MLKSFAVLQTLKKMNNKKSTFEQKCRRLHIYANRHRFPANIVFVVFLPYLILMSWILRVAIIHKLEMSEDLDGLLQEDCLK